MRKIHLEKLIPIHWGYALTMAILFGMLIFSVVESGRLLLYAQETASTTAYLSARVATLENDLQTKTVALSDSLYTSEQDIGAIQNRLGGFEKQVGAISGSVGVLEKLAKTDPELLQKYSKVFFLNEHFVPERVVQIDQSLVYSETRPEQIHASVWPKLSGLMASAKSQGIELYVKSAYRSFDEQKSLKSSYSVVYGAGTANTFSADQGYSEHQLGTTVDFITKGLGGALEGFDGTPAYPWLLNNAHRFGFVLSYPKNNQYYIFEPWHWRYVGVALATYLHDNGLSFYDMEQRKIDEYLVNIFD